MIEDIQSAACRMGEAVYDAVLIMWVGVWGAISGAVQHLYTSPANIRQTSLGKTCCFLARSIGWQFQSS